LLDLSPLRWHVVCARVLKAFSSCQNLGERECSKLIVEN
jgi:hypothetical protein